MTDLETLEGHVVQEVDALPAVRPGALLEGTTPRAQIATAHAVAAALADVIEKQRLFTDIKGKKYVLVQGWTLLGSLLGVFPVLEWSRPIGDGWEARVEARTLSGAIVGAAEATCSRSEKRWTTADDYAIRSMAQTRATSKALRAPLDFVMTLAGYEATPEEEMPRDTTAIDTRITGGPEPLRKPRSWKDVQEALKHYDEDTSSQFMLFAAAARNLVFGKTNEELGKEEKRELLNLTGQAVQALYAAVEPGQLPPPSKEDLRAAWASVLEGQELALPGESEGAA